MLTPPILTSEQERILELYNYEILDTSPEEEFEEIVQLATQICKVPISLISLVETGRQWFKAKVGLEPYETSKEVSFCAHALACENELFEVCDASKDYRFFDNPLVTSNPNIRFYAGVPLVSKNGYKLGTLCVINSEPQQLSEEQSFALKVLARQVMKLFDLRLNNKLLDAQKHRLKQQAEMQNRIISIIAHDVRSPVASLKQIVDFNNSFPLSDNDIKDLLSLAGNHLDSTLSLLSDLLDWGRLQMQVHTSENTSFNLHKLVVEKAHNFHAAISLKNNKIVNLIDKDLVICSDLNAIKFILRNLISNANKYTENGLITVYGQREKERVLITVSDTGIGMDEKTKNDLFQGASNISKLGTRREKGTGLGLMFTKDFIDMMQATISINSEVGKGTTFYIEMKA